MSCKFCSGRNVLMVVCELNCFIFELLFFRKILGKLVHASFSKEKTYGCMHTRKKVSFT